MRDAAGWHRPARPKHQGVAIAGSRPRRDVPVPGHCKTFGGGGRTTSECLRMPHSNLDVMRYIDRESLALKNF